MSKDLFITIRVTKQEKDLLRKFAKESNTTLSKYILDNAIEKAAAKSFIKHSDKDNMQLSFFDKDIIKYCQVCGKMLSVGSIYCIYCGSKTD